MSNAMKLTMPRFDAAPVLVVGDVMLDRYWHGPSERISPEAPVPVIRVDQIEDRPGGAGNVALNIAALGAPAWLVGVTGEDEAAEILRRRLNAAGVYCAFQSHAQQPTITKLRVMSRHQQLLRVDFEESFSTDGQAMLETVGGLLDKVKVVILSDYGKGALVNHQALIALARERGLPVLADPKGKDFSIYRVAALITALDLQTLLVTRSEHGMTLLRQGEAPLHLPARAREVFDVTGAGDTVISTLAAVLAAGESLPLAVALANLAAGIVIGKLGTAAISAPELRRAVQHTQGAGRGVMSTEQLLVALEDARAHGERIVFTNGCFDIIHAGHVGYLEEARAQGDRLVVAINDDASVTRLKGPGRPINAVDRRMAVLAGLEAVDWVVSFAEDTPEALLEQVRPDVLVKGGDYGIDQVVGAPIVQAYGGEVKVLKFVDSCSTTVIVEKIRRQDSAAP